MEPEFAENMSMDEIMRIWPQTIRVILDHRMLCVGCPIASFHTIADACREHDVSEWPFRRDIERAAGAKCGKV